MKQHFTWKQLPALLCLLFVSISAAIAQTNGDLEKMGKDGEAFEFHLKFNYASTDIATEKYKRVEALLDKYNASIPADLARPFKVQGEAAANRPDLTTEQQRRLTTISKSFFNELSSLGLSLRDLQAFQANFNQQHAQPGENVLKPEKAWNDKYSGMEKALMGGRTLLVMDIWKNTLVEFFNRHPEAVGVIYGKMDIGSWVKMDVKGLGFPADIDFSTIGTDKKYNQILQQLFNTNLQNVTGLDMIKLDAVHTAHGMAGAEVFIGEWGKIFAEVDMLNRGKWQLLNVIKDKDGRVISVESTEMSGKSLFMKKGIENELSAEKTDKNAFDPKEKYPELSMTVEPMLSLEMLRHAMHDVEHGPFEGGQKIIKMIKYTERSFYVLNEALKTLSSGDQSSFVQDYQPSEQEQKLMILCEEITANKGNSEKVVSLLEAYSGASMQSASAVQQLVNSLGTQCKEAMLKNASRAFSYRMRGIALIKEDESRYAEADKLLQQLNEEFQKGFGASGVQVPAAMLRAHSILVDLRAGKISPEVMNARLEELNKLMEKEYKVDRSLVERLTGDAWASVTKYLKNKGYNADMAARLVDHFKKGFEAGWQQYAPELAYKSSISAFEFAGHVRTKIDAFHQHLAKTKTGKLLNSELVNQLDNIVSLYDAWMTGKDTYESAKNVSFTIATTWAQGKWPFVAIPLGIYNSIQTGSVKPVALAVTFYIFPVVGQVYMVTNLADRLVVSNVRDYTFRSHLDRLAVMAQTNGQGQVVRFKIPRAFTGLTGSPDSLETDPEIPAAGPERIAAIKQVFYNPEFLYCPDIKYFISLIPKKYDQFGLYETKIENLKTLFAFDEEFLGYLISIEKFKKDKEAGLIAGDEFQAQRDKLIDELATEVEDNLWLAVFKAIESTKSGEQSGVLAEKEAKLKQLEADLLLGDYRMKEIGKLGLLTTVRQKIENDPMYVSALKSNYSKGSAYGRVAVPVMNDYIQAYTRITEIQKEIYAIWQSFDANSDVLQDKLTRLLLTGANSGSPMLINDMNADLDNAVKCLEATKRRANDIRVDLTAALGRPIDNTADKEHLRILGEYGLQLERLTDAAPSGRSPLYKGDANAIEEKRAIVSKAYQEYLEKIKSLANQKLTIQVQGETSTKLKVPVTLRASIVNAAQVPKQVLQNLSIVWYSTDQGTPTRIAEGESYVVKAEKEGEQKFSVALEQKGAGKSTILDQKQWAVKVSADANKNNAATALIKAPAVIRQYDIVDVSVNLPADLAASISDCSWGSDAVEGKNNCASAKLQFTEGYSTRQADGTELVDDSVQVGMNYDIQPSGSSRTIRKYLSQKVKFQALYLNASASSIWDGGAGKDGVGLNRKTIQGPPRSAPWAAPGEIKSRSSAYATVNVRKASLSAANLASMEALSAYVQKTYGDERWGKQELVSINMADFKGYGMYRAPVFTNGSWSDAGYKDCGAGAALKGVVIKGRAAFEINWSAGASGAFDNEDKTWMMSMVDALANECKSIVSGITFMPVAGVTKTAYNGPNPDGSDWPSVSIEPKIDTVQPGAKVVLKAVVKNDKPDYGPYTYSWQGNLTGAANTASVTLNTSRPGPASVSVAVSGKTPPGSAEVQYVVAPLKVKLQRTTPATGNVVVGQPVSLSAVFVGAIPAGRNLQYLWQPHPEEKFTPFEGKGNTTTVTFTSPGRKKVWVQVQDKTTTDVFTMGESAPLEIVVEKPLFNITFTPAKALVGQEVKAKINSKPAALSDVSYKWMPLPANAKLLGESADGSEIRFITNNPLQVTIEVAAVVKGSGESLGGATANFTADRYTIKATGPKAMGPKPTVWKPGVGVVEVDKEIAVHQIVEFNTELSPLPTTELRYNWTVTEGQATISNPASKEARVTALATGNVALNVEVKNRDGIVLGSAVASFNASISQEMINDGKRQQQVFDSLQQQARTFIREGKMNEAVEVGVKLQQLNSKAAAAVLTEIATACKQSAKDAIVKRDFALAINRYEQVLQFFPNDATAKAQLVQTKKWQTEWATVLQKGEELDGNIARKNLPAAFNNVQQLNKLQLNMPGQMGNEWSKQKMADYDKLQKECSEATRLMRTNWTANFKANNFEAALPELEAFKAEWTAMPEVMKDVESSIQLCKSRIAENKTIYQNFLDAKARMEKTQVPDPKYTAANIEYQAVTKFYEQDARRMEMVEYARGMDAAKKAMIENSNKAAQLKMEAASAEAAGDLETALEKYKESNALKADAAVEAKIKKLDAEVSARKAVRNEADQLWTEAEQLLKKKRTKEDGFAKMKQSLMIWRDADRLRRATEVAGEMTDQQFSRVPMQGRWNHGDKQYFIFDNYQGRGVYDAKEKGFDDAVGKLTMIDNIGFIDYTTKQGVKGEYQLTLTSDGNSATGVWKDSRKQSGTRLFQRLIAEKPATATATKTNTTKPAATPTPAPTQQEQPKKGGGFGKFLDKVSKGLTTIDSVLTVATGTKPTPTEQPTSGKSSTGTTEKDQGVAPADASTEVTIFNNGNIAGVSNKPTAATEFTLSSATYVTRIENYHYYNRGAKPGTIAIVHSNGTKYGPWQAYGVIGQGGVQNATWVAQPNTTLPAGKYTVIDSDPSTWSYNLQSKGCGFTRVWARKSGNTGTSTSGKTGASYKVEEVGGGVKAENVFIAGDIDNLGFGFPKGFDVFSGNSTPVHGYPWIPTGKDAPGTDRIIIGSSGGSNDGYSSSTSRPDNKPEAITLYCNVGSTNVNTAILQMFVDDFQAPAIGSNFTVTINGRRAAFLESILNSLNQTGPIGKLISAKIPEDFKNEIYSGKLVIMIDDATTGRGDGFAIDFVRLIINASSFDYTGTISGVIYRPDGQPAVGAKVSAGGMINTTTDSKGTFVLSKVPAGLISITSSYNGHHQNTKTVDLAAGQSIRITINLPSD